MRTSVLCALLLTFVERMEELAEQDLMALGSVRQYTRMNSFKSHKSILRHYLSKVFRNSHGNTGGLLEYWTRLQHLQSIRTCQMEQMNSVPRVMNKVPPGHRLFSCLSAVTVWLRRLASGMRE